MSVFDDLVELRSELQEFTSAHEASLESFYNAQAGWFELRVPTDGFRGSGGVPVRHLTTTITCLESLYERSDRLPQIDILPAELAEDTEKLESEPQPGDAASDFDRHDALIRFARAALDNPSRWKSDEAAYVYCRVRTLGALLRLAEASDLEKIANNQEILGLVLDAWASRDDDGVSYGLRESTVDPRTEDGHPFDRKRLTGPPSDKTYPANAFLTYWGLLALDGLPSNVKPAEAERMEKAALDWMEKCSALQVAFRYNRSTHADPQQLAWSICALVRFGQHTMAAHTTTAYAQLTAGLRAFFAQQDESTGQWDKGQPLFHYPNAGNAYCYGYETAAELVSLATRDGALSETLRDALLPYLPNLRMAFRAARDSRQQLGDGSWGWSSGHHPHRVQPEAWATASVYRYAEALRRLVGVWTNAEAQRLLQARRQPLDVAKKLLNVRGGTWDAGWGSAGAQLSTGFVNHVLRAETVRSQQSTFVPDPDEKVIPKHGARSAILFGPPGTGKTTLVRAVAEAVGWPFIEIVPAQFLDQGVDLASKRADEIFRQVMELDRCVVLLDEIDELIQARTRDAEPTERFFTTTMLPRLARLWERRKILFFVNTNNVSRVDAAIRRGQRFDYGIFVMPPGFARKRQALHAAGPVTGLDEDTITRQLLEVRSNPGNAVPNVVWLPLVRHDQLQSLTEQLSKIPRNEMQPYNIENVNSALTDLIDDLRAFDWAPEPDRRNQPDARSEKAMPAQVSEMLKAQRREQDVRLIVELSNELKTNLGIPGGESYRTLPASVKSPDLWASERGYRLAPNGVLHLK